MIDNEYTARCCNTYDTGIHLYVHVTYVFVLPLLLCVAALRFLLQSCFLLLLFVMVCGMTHFVDMDYELPLIPVISLCS